MFALVVTASMLAAFGCGNPDGELSDDEKLKRMQGAMESQRGGMAKDPAGATKTGQ